MTYIIDLTVHILAGLGAVKAYDFLSKFNSCDIYDAHNLLMGCQIILKFCTEHGSGTAMLCAKFWNDLTNVMDAMYDWDLEEFELKAEF